MQEDMNQKVSLAKGLFSQHCCSSVLFVTKSVLYRNVSGKLICICGRCNSNLKILATKMGQQEIRKWNLKAFLFCKSISFRKIKLKPKQIQIFVPTEKVSRTEINFSRSRPFHFFSSDKWETNLIFLTRQKIRGCLKSTMNCIRLKTGH